MQLQLPGRAALPVTPDLRRIRIAALIEAATLTGPAKNLLAFAAAARTPPPGLPAIDFTLLTYLRGGAASNAFIEEARARRLDVRMLREARAFDPSVIRQMRAVLAGVAPDIVQTHAVKSHFLYRISGLPFRWIAFHHGYTAPDWRMRLYNQLDRWSLRAPAQLVTVCGPFAAQLTALGLPAERIVVRHNMIAPFVPAPEERVAALRSAWNIPAGELVFLCPGRLSSEKGQRDLIEAVGLLARRSDLPPFRLVIAGDGPERARLESRCRALDLGERVLFTGHQPSLAEWYSLADAMALPSHSEGSPNALLEGMAAGLAVVATSVGGVPEIATSGQDALLVPPHAPAELAEAIRTVASDPELRSRLGRAAVEVVDRFTPAAYQRAMAAIYERVLSTPPRP